MHEKLDACIQKTYPSHKSDHIFNFASIRPRPIMLKILPIMLLSNVKKLLIIFNIMLIIMNDATVQVQHLLAKSTELFFP